MKTTFRVQMPEPYCYLELEGEAESFENALEKYQLMAALTKVETDGLPVKKFNEIMDLMIERKPIQEDPGILEGMNPSQKFIFDFVRRSIGRIDYKNR